MATARCQQQQHGGQSGGRRQRQLGSDSARGGSAAAEAAVGDGRDEGGEVVTWRLFMFVIYSEEPIGYPAQPGVIRQSVRESISPSVHACRLGI